MDDHIREFLRVAHAAAMLTVRPDGTPHAARVALGLVDDRLLSSVLPNALRHSHIRRDPRASLFVFDPMDPSNARRWLALETTVTVHVGLDAPELNLGLRKVLQRSLDPAPPPGMISWAGEVMTEDAFLDAVREEGRMIYEFAVLRAYGPG